MAPQVWPLGLPPSPVFSSPSPAGGCRDQWGPLKPQRSPWKAGACVPERVRGAEATLAPAPALTCSMCDVSGALPLSRQAMTT